MSDARGKLRAAALPGCTSSDHADELITNFMREVQRQTLVSACRALGDTSIRGGIVQEMADRHPSEDPGAMLSGIDGAAWYLESVAADMWIDYMGG